MKRLIIALSALLLLAACGGPSPDQAPDAVVDYLTALVNKEGDQLISLTCAEYEAEAQRELDSFAAVDAELDNVACFLADPNAEGEEVLVNCEGALLVTYNNEDQRVDLSGRTYAAQYEAGAWRVCGFSD